MGGETGRKPREEKCTQQVWQAARLRTFAGRRAAGSAKKCAYGTGGRQKGSQSTTSARARPPGLKETESDGRGC